MDGEDDRGAVDFGRATLRPGGIGSPRFIGAVVGMVLSEGIRGLFPEGEADEGEASDDFGRMADFGREAAEVVIFGCCGA